MMKSAQTPIPTRKFSMPIGGLTALGVSLAASLTALISVTPDLQAGLDADRARAAAANGGSGRIVVAQAAPDGAGAYQGTPPPGYGGAMGVVQDWLARANRDYQGVVIKGLSIPQAGDAASDEIARKIEETRRDAARAAATGPSADADRQAADAKAREEAERGAAAQAKADAERAAEAQRREAAEKAEAARKAAEAQAEADAKANKAAADAKAVADAKLAAQAKAEAELQAKSAAAAQAAANAAAKAEAQRLANEREEQAQRDADQRRAAEAEARRFAEEQRKAEARIAEERRRAEAAAQPAPPAAAASPPEPEIEKPTVEERRAVVVTAEPIRRPAPTEANAAAPSARADRPSRRGRHGARVKRWMHRRYAARVCRAAGRRIHPPGRYTVARGDSLWRISSKHYRTGRLYRKIYRANRRLIAHPSRIYPCQRFYVPRRRR
ncbi:MAG: LysM peptidoglycan-binding domain-containing protein [Hyphomicrobium sp.]